MKFHELTSARLAKVDRGETLVLIPIAAVEQHGPHMPTGTDAVLCGGVAEAVEEKLSQHLLLLPTLWLGASSHHLRFGATLNSRLDTFISTLCDIAKSLLDDGFQRLFFLNGHGGNIDPMRIAVRELQPDYPTALLAAGSYWDVADQAIQDVLTGEHKFVGHACEFETSLMMHLRPELVEHDQIGNGGELVPDQVDGVFVSRDMRQRTKQGFTGRPDIASAAKGELLFERIVDKLMILVNQLLTQPLGTEYSQFVSE